MNSFQQLNTYSSQTITYNNGSGYSLVFANALGNGTVTSNTSVYHTLQDRQPIVTFTGSTQPIIVNIQSPNDANGACLSNVVYAGNNANLSVTAINSTTWCIGNVWSVADYNEVFVNTLAYINSSRTEDFFYSTNITDQQGNNRSFYTNVDVIPFGFSYPSTVTFNEDANAIIDGLSISDLANNSYSVTMSLANASVGTMVLNSNARTGTTQVISGTKSQINTALAGNITYVPADDYVSSSNIALTVLNTTTSNVVLSSNIQLQIGATHAEFSYPTQLNYGINANAVVGTTPYGNLRITDQATNRNYSVTAVMGNIVGGNLYIASTNYGNTVSLAGNITTVNNQLANLVIVPSGSGGSNTSIVYTQTQTTANIAQGNITLPVTYTPTTWHINNGAERATGTLTYSVANAMPEFSANADFWRGQWYPGNLQPYTTAPAITSMRDNTNFKSGGISLKLSNIQSFTSAYDTSVSDAALSTVEFWIYPTAELGNSGIAQINTTTTAGDGYGLPTDSLKLGTVNNEMFLYPFVPEVVDNTRWYQRAVLGTITANVWTHIAFQRNDSSNTASSLSCWVNGEPKTTKYTLGSPSNGMFGSPTGPYGAAWMPNSVKQVWFGQPAKRPTGVTGAAITKFQGLIDNFSITNSAVYTPGVAFTPTTVPPQPGGNVRQIINGV